MAFRTGVVRRSAGRRRIYARGRLTETALEVACLARETG